MRLISETHNGNASVLVWVDDDKDAVVVVQDNGKDVDRMIMRRSAFLAIADIITADGER